MEQQKMSPTMPTLILLTIAGFVCYFFFMIITNLTGDFELDVRRDITKEEAAQAAIQFIQSTHENRAFHSFVALQTDKSLSSYLNQNKLVKQFNKEFGELYPLEYFLVELVDVQHAQNRYLVHVHMKTGNVIGWHQVGDTQHSPHTEANIQLVESYIDELGYPLADYQLLTERGSTYVFENNQQHVGEAKHQLQLMVQDEQVVYFHPQFSVPESFHLWLEEQDSSMAWMTIISVVSSVIMGLVAIILTIVYRKQITFRRGLVLTFVFFVTYSLHNVNMVPGYMSIFIEETNPEFYVIFNIILLTFITLIMGITVYLSLVSGEVLWRKELKNPWPRWHEPTFGHHVIHSMGKGYLFAPVILILQAVLFFIGEHYFDVWTVNDPLFSNYNLSLPMLFPILAWAAAISEEAIYRLFGIILFKKIVRNTFLAVLLPSIIWALAHVQYPIYPVYTRLIEVTILGLIFGYIFLKHGFFTAVFTHVIVNSVLMGLSLIFSLGGMANSLMSVLFIFSPVIVAYIIFWLHSYRRRNGRIIPQS